MEEYAFVIEEDLDRRLDVCIVERMPHLSRSFVQKLITDGYVTVNSKTQRPGYKVRRGDHIKVAVPKTEPTTISAQNIPLDVLYEDDHIIVINKPKGMAVHPAPGNWSGTLVNAILAHCPNLSGIGGVERPGIVHRLDKDTSGLIVVAKTDQAHRMLQQQIQKRTAERKYTALVWDETKFNEAVVEAPIGRHPTDRQKMAVIKDTTRYTAREAITRLRVIERYKGFTLLEAKLETGRTHQIRVHCSFIGHPVVGDPVYGGTKRTVPQSYSKLQQQELEQLIGNLQGQALHAHSLVFEHPFKHEMLSFEAPLPPDMQALVDWLRKNS